MRRLRPTDVAIPLTAAAGSCAEAAVSGAGLLDASFAAVLWTALLFALRETWRARTDAVRQGRRAKDLQATSTETTARAEVVAERARLSVEIEAYVRELVAGIGQRATAAVTAADPRPDIAWIQLRAQQANGELRRQLGLLRIAEETGPPPASIACPASPRLRFGDLVVAAGLMALATIERLVLLPMEGRSATWFSSLLTTGTAATVLGRRAFPVWAAICAGTLLALGAITRAPVQDGLWLGATLALLAWTLAIRGGRFEWLSLALLAVTSLASRHVNQPENMPIVAVILTVASGVGALVGRHRRRSTVAQLAAGERTVELRDAVTEAVQAERRQVARELHDLVSNAVSLVAVQAGAADVVWPTDPGAARESLQIVASTAEQTVAELDRLVPGQAAVERTMEDVSRLVDRMRAAGLIVELTVDTDPSPALMTTIYRVVQESMTNALRYAPDGRVTVTISSDGGSAGNHLTAPAMVQVISGGAVRPPGGRRGLGLIGLQERVEQSGGTLHVGSRTDPPGFAVTARLPAGRDRLSS